MESHKKRDTIILTIASVATVAGAIILIVALLTAPAPEATFGWFAYAPLSDAVFVPGGLLVFPTWALGGVGLFVAGAVAISYMIGRRSGSNHRHEGSGLPRSSP